MVFALNLLYSGNWPYLNPDHELKNFAVCGSDSTLAWRRSGGEEREMLQGALWRKEAWSASEEEERGSEL